MPPRKTPQDASDHDLLIKIDTRLEVLQASVRENNAALNTRLDSLVREKANITDLDPLRNTIAKLQEEFGAQCDDLTSKADKTEFKDIADKLDATRRLVFIGIGILLAVQVIGVPILVAILIKVLVK